MRTKKKLKKENNIKTLPDHKIKQLTQELSALKKRSLPNYREKNYKTINVFAAMDSEYKTELG